MNPDLKRRLRPLRILLNDLYRTDGAIQRILSDSGISAGEVAPSGPTLDRWHQILTIATTERQTDGLIEIACADHPNRADEIRRLHADLAPFLPGERNPSRAAQLLHESEATTSEVLDWPTTLPSGETIKRPERKIIEGHLADPEIAVIIVLGEAGSGKSALLATVARALQAAGVRVLGMRLDRLARDVTTSEGLQKYLSLSEPLVDTVSALDSQGPTVVFIDQLDALCELMTERAGRLSLVLDTVERLAALPNTHVVLATRPFEFKHDVRLRRVAATEVELALPPWTDLEPHLAGTMVDASLLSEELRDELRRPQTLRTFLQLVAEGNDWRQLRTYHDMREQLWQAHVAKTPAAARRQATLYELARWMASEEVLTRPLAQMDEYRAEIQVLESAGWLRRVGVAGVTFRHQSLFDFAYARAVVSAGGSLLQHVLERQGLFIRRRIWAVLAYLREASLEQYLREFERLWRAPLRRHLRRLLIDFLGQIPVPEQQEVARMRATVMDPEWSVPAVIAAGRGTGWFGHLHDRELPAAMTEPKTAWLCTAILTGAPSSENDRVLLLLRQHWITDFDRQVRCAHVLSQRKTWTPGALALARDLLRELAPRANQHIVEQIVIAAGERRSGDGIDLFAEALDATIEKLLEEFRSVTRTPPPPTDSDFADTWKWVSEQDKLCDPIRNQFEGSIHWTRLSALVGQAPDVFVIAVWPILIKALGAIGRTDREVALYRNELRWREPYHPTNYLLIEHLRTAVVAFARSQPDDFVEFSLRVRSSDLMTVHTLLLEGFAAIADVRPRAMIEYLREDRRRMVVGSSCSSSGESLHWIKVAGKIMEANAQQELAAIIAAWRLMDEFPKGWSPEHRRHQRQDDRRTRLALWLCLDVTKLDASMRARIEEEMRVFPREQGDTPIDDNSGEAHMVVSRMKAEQMAKASDSQILRFFQELPDETEWEHPRHFMRGGSIEASRELEKFAGSSPDRALSLIQQMSPITHQRPVGMVIDALAKGNFDSQKLLSCVEWCELRGFGSPEYRVSVGWALEKIAAREGQSGLPDTICAILEPWLADVNSEERDSEPMTLNRPNRILYKSRGFSTIPQGNYTVLHTLFVGFASRNSPGWDRWVEVLEAHLQRQEHLRVWQALAAHDLTFLGRAGVDRAARFVERLMEKFPGLMTTPEGAVLVDRWQSSISPEVTQRWVVGLLARGTSHAAQIFGELLVLRHFRLPGDDWARSRIDAALDLIEPFDSAQAAMRRGIAFGSSLLWREGLCVDDTAQWLLRLVPWEDTGVNVAIMDLFRSGEGPPYSVHADSLMRLLEKHPFHLRQDRLDGFLNAMGDYITPAPERVAAVAFAVIDAHRQELGDIRLSAARYAEKLIDLALTLQDMLGSFERGLDLFERLQDLNLNEIEAVLNEQAYRPGVQILRAQRRRRARSASSD